MFKLVKTSQIKQGHRLLSVTTGNTLCGMDGCFWTNGQMFILYKSGDIQAGYLVPSVTRVQVSRCVNTAADVPEDSVLSGTSIGAASKSVITTVCGPVCVNAGNARLRRTMRNGQRRSVSDEKSG